MTNITFYVKSDKSIIGFKSKGHAGFGVRGTDVVLSLIHISEPTRPY